MTASSYQHLVNTHTYKHKHRQTHTHKHTRTNTYNHKRTHKTRGGRGDPFFILDARSSISNLRLRKGAQQGTEIAMHVNCVQYSEIT